MKKRLVAILIVLVVVVCAFPVCAFAEYNSQYSINSYSEYPYDLYDGKYTHLVNHTDVIVRSSAGQGYNGTMYIGYYFTVDRANITKVNGLWWSKITPDNLTNPYSIDQGYTASYLLN